MNSWMVFGIACAVAVLATSALANIQYRLYPVSTGPGGVAATPLPASGVIDIGSVTEATELHIFDDSGVDDSAGPIKVRGSSDGSPIRVKIVGPNDVLAFESSVFRELTAGMRDLGGLRFVGVNPDGTDNARYAEPAGVRTVADIFAFLSSWFGNCSCNLPSLPPSRGCPCLVGVNPNCQAPAPRAPVLFDPCP